MDRVLRGPQELDISGQQPSLAIYTQLCLCYRLTGPETHQRIVETLRHGLEKLTASFPWAAAQVVNIGKSDTNAGTFVFTPLEATPRLCINDLRDDPRAPTWDALESADFPFRLLDENLLCPRTTIPTGTEGSRWPVLLVQANFIHGGLLLTFTSSHQAMDMTGHGQLMHLLDKACNDVPFAEEEEVTTGNLERSTLIPFLDGPLPDLPFQDVTSAMHRPSLAAPPPDCIWSYFSFPAESLQVLKSTATADLSSGFVSTDDVLTAFIWQSISRSRTLRLPGGTETTLARAVDPRRHLGVPPTYPGIIQNMVYHKAELDSLAKRPLGHLAQELRQAIDPNASSLEYDTRVFLTKLHRSPLKDAVSVTTTIDTAKDLMLSSWAKQDCYSLDFGLGLGMPVCVRRPQFIPHESLLYLMPKRLDGEIALAICLRPEDLERLQNDEVFSKYAKSIS